MKVRIEIEVEASKTLIETIKRSGFHLHIDGTTHQIKVPNSPSIPKRKAKITFIDITSENVASK